MKGDIGGTTVSVQKNGDGFTITSKRAGKVLSVGTLTPGADGKMTISNENKEDGSTMKYVANKQS